MHVVPSATATQLSSTHDWQSPQVAGQSTETPQASTYEPHLPVQSGCDKHPQTPSVPPPPHVAGDSQVPQSLMAPQSSVKVPQLRAADWHEVVATHVQTLAMQVRPEAQSLSVQHWPGARQTPSQTSWPLGQHCSSA